MPEQQLCSSLESSKCRLRESGGRPRRGTLEEGMTLITCCGVPAWPSVPVGASHSYSIDKSIENEAKFKV